MTELTLLTFVVLRLGIFIRDGERDGSSKALSALHAGKDGDLVEFLSLHKAVLNKNGTIRRWSKERGSTSKQITYGGGKFTLSWTPLVRNGKKKK